MVKQSEGYDIRRLIGLLLSKIWIVVICAILVGASSFIYTKFAVPLKYESYTSLYVRSDRSLTTTGNSSEVDMNTLRLSQSLVSTYVVVLQSDSVMDKIGNLLVLEFDEETLASVFKIEDGKITTNSIKNCFTMAAINDTEAMKISAVTTNPEISAALCNMMAQVAPDFLIRVVGAGSVEIIDPAVANYTPVSASIPKNTLLGVLVGTVLAVAFIFVVDFFDDTVKDPDEISDLFNKAVLGEVQNIESGSSSKKKNKDKGKGSDREPRKLLTDKNLPFAVTESYKSIRTNILFSLGTSDKKIIAVSSANPMDGKSTVSANIAIAFAQTSSRVLLIDADMRKPIQHKSFHLSNNKGLSTLIVNMSTFEESIKKDVVENLDVLTSGPMPPNPSELLASAQYTEMLDNLSKVYDYIIIDTPPINVVSDAMIMSNSVSGVLMVLKYGVTTYGDVTDAMKQFELANTNLIGFVLNDIENGGRGSYYKYSYKYYYKYSYKYNADYAYRNSNDEETDDDDDDDD